MSLTRILESPEIEMEVSKLINRMQHLNQGYLQAQMRCLSDEINLPSFGRLFELIRQLETRYVEEIIRFQISRGQKITWFDIKPVETFEKSKPVDIIQTFLNLEKEIHQMTVHLCKSAQEKSDLPLTSFLQDRIILRQVKVIRKRANQFRDLKRSNDDVTPLLTGRLNVRFEVEKLEKRLRMEMTRREWGNYESREDIVTSLVGSTTRF